MSANDFEQDWSAMFNQMVSSGDIHPAIADDKLVPREIDRKYIALHEELGNGEYGAVWKASLDESEGGGGPEFLVAAKTVKLVCFCSVLNPLF